MGMTERARTHEAEGRRQLRAKMSRQTERHPGGPLACPCLVTAGTLPGRCEARPGRHVCASEHVWVCDLCSHPSSISPAPSHGSETHRMGRYYSPLGSVSRTLAGLAGVTQEVTPMPGAGLGAVCSVAAEPGPWAQGLTVAAWHPNAMAREWLRKTPIL